MITTVLFAAAMACPQEASLRAMLPDEERDTSAASIMAAGLIELATFVPGEKGAKYRAFAVKQLLSLCRRMPCRDCRRARRFGIIHA